MSSFTPVFSGGTGRSGTTVLAKLLRCHPQVRASRPLEIRCVTDSLGVLDLCVGVRPDAAWRVRLVARSYRASEWEFQRRMRGRWWERENRLGNSSGLYRGLTETQREEMLAHFGDRWRREPQQAARELLDSMVLGQGLVDERLWIDTSPPNIANADRIHALWPEAHFVHMVRDGRDTIASVLDEKWGPSDVESAALWWEHRMRAAHVALSKVPEASVLTLSLESLVVDDRDGGYERLLEFFELPNRPRMRRYFTEQMPADRVRVGAWRDRVADPRALERSYQAAASRLTADGIPTYEHPA